MAWDQDSRKSDNSRRAISCVNMDHKNSHLFESDSLRNSLQLIAIACDFSEAAFVLSQADAAPYQKAMKGISPFRLFNTEDRSVFIARYLRKDD